MSACKATGERASVPLHVGDPAVGQADLVDRGAGLGSGIGIAVLKGRRFVP